MINFEIKIHPETTQFQQTQHINQYQALSDKEKEEKFKQETENIKALGLKPGHHIKTNQPGTWGIIIAIEDKIENAQWYNKEACIIRSVNLDYWKNKTEAERKNMTGVKYSLKEINLEETLKPIQQNTEAANDAC